MGRDLENIDMRVAGRGQWRVMGKDKYIYIPGNNQVIGKRNTLNFWDVQGAYARRTEWVMHEFRLVFIANPSKMANWSVYRIFKNKDEKKVKDAKWCNEESSNGESIEVNDFNIESDYFS
ncbi:NAC domain-containing protein 83-like [Lotus japonicus]|uniref:NAC domain-containing protein 83-like n=1 Tax=Lotus japonicus TaxID=34305 RepID=UPI002583B58A|nr:NAC domain-containing protein 83-like [Lotus japonicus]